jgi:acetyl esterase/lipase
MQATSGPARLKALAIDCLASLALLAVNVPATFGAYRRRANIAYGPDRRHRLDVYLPTRARAEPAPMIVFWHGGRWTTGDKVEYRFVGAALAELGCVTVIPNYRRYPTVKLRGFMEDAARAAAWADEHARDLGADALRLYTMGHSAGAHIAALLTLDSRYFAAVGRRAPRIAGLIGLSGPYDFLPLKEDDVKDMFGPPERYADSQPVNFVRADSPPALLIHGSKDRMVAPGNSSSLAATLHARGVAATLRLYAHSGHADTVAALSRPARRRAATLPDIAAFVNPARLQAASDAATAGIA